MTLNEARRADREIGTQRRIKHFIKCGRCQARRSGQIPQGFQIPRGFQLLTGDNAHQLFDRLLGPVHDDDEEDPNRGKH